MSTEEFGEQEKAINEKIDAVLKELEKIEDVNKRGTLMMYVVLRLSTETPVPAAYIISALEVSKFIVVSSITMGDVATVTEPPKSQPSYVG